MRKLLFAALLAVCCTSAHAGLVADFRFQNTLADHLGIAPDLIPALPDDAEGGFATESVDGVERIVRLFGYGGGFVLDVDGLLGSDVYTVALVMRFNETSGYRRILDTLGGTSDNGFYVLGGSLVLYPTLTDRAGNEFTTEWHQVVVTRNAAGTVSAYLNGTPVFSVQDEDLALPINEDRTLRFLVDDAYEDSKGAVARIRVWNEALVPASVAALDDNQRSFQLLRDGFESP